MTLRVLKKSFRSPNFLLPMKRQKRQLRKDFFRRTFKGRVQFFHSRNGEGTIKDDQGKVVWFSWRNVANRRLADHDQEGHVLLRKGQRVEFEIEENADGFWAVEVVLR